jgi:hypothetical protein
MRLFTAQAEIRSGYRTGDIKGKYGGIKEYRRRDLKLKKAIVSSIEHWF